MFCKKFVFQSCFTFSHLIQFQVFVTFTSGKCVFTPLIFPISFSICATQFIFSQVLHYCLHIEAQKRLQPEKLSRSVPQNYQPCFTGHSIHTTHKHHKKHNTETDTRPRDVQCQSFSLAELLQRLKPVWALFNKTFMLLKSPTVFGMQVKSRGCRL